jgi:predicted chitinase
VVRPGEITGNGPAMAQAGAQNFNRGHVYDTFPRGGTQFFVNDTGRVGGGDQPAPTPTTEAGKLAADAYRSVLRREPDAGGLDNWTGAAQAQLEAGSSKEQVAGWLDSQFHASDEYQALVATDQAFQNVLGRDVSGGRGYWHEQAVSWQREGVSLPEISSRLESALRGSDEYKLNHLDELVNGIYQELLGRDADPDGLATWTGLASDLKAQGKSVGEIHDAIAGRIRESDEYKSKQGGVTLEQLRAIMPNLPLSKAQQYLPYLNQAMAEAQINTPPRKAAFLAQLAHESVQLQFMEEIASGAEYEGRKDLGNIYPGDGVRYKGRGPIQLTGRYNYRNAGAALGLDLENNPTRAADPDIAFRIAGWYWTTHNLNAKADAGNFDGITLAINGGYNGKASRDAYWAKAKQVLGA